MELKDVVQFYLGCPLSNGATLQAHYFLYGNMAQIESGKVKPILRRIEDMTEEEITVMFIKKGLAVPKRVTRTSIDKCFIQIEYDTEKEYQKSDWQHIITMYPAQFAYLCKQGFDLFGLIESNQAIDAKTLQP